MTTDIENELRELLRDKAGEAPVTTPSAPPRVLRRSRVRQAWTVAGAGVLMLALIVGSVAGLTRILGDGRDDGEVGNGGYDVFERTATIEAFTVTGPSDWYLVNAWPLSMQIAVEGSSGTSGSCVAAPGTNKQECTSTTESSEPLPLPEGLSMIQLTNLDLGLETNACRDGIPSEGAALYVALDAERAIAGVADPSIPPFPPAVGLPPEGDGPCGPGRYARFTVNGEPFFTWIGLGSGVSDQDRETVQTAYERMSAVEDWSPVPPDHVTPAYVIAGGTTARYGAWRIEVRPSGANVEMMMLGVVGASHGEFAVPERAIDWCCEGTANGVLFGAVQIGASGVEFQPDGGAAPIAGTIVSTPPSLGSGFDLFFLEGADGLGDVVAVGLGAGEAISPSPSAPPTAGPRSDEVELSGTYEEQEWQVRFTGAFTGPGSPCWEVTVDGPPSEACPDPVHSTIAGPSPYMVDFDLPSLHLLAGSVPPEVVELRFTGDDDAIVPQQFRCAMGPIGWTDPDRKVCAIALPATGSGTLGYIDADGAVLFEEGIGWGAAEAASLVPPVDPIQGGTYWAVYLWLGPAGSDEGNRVVGQVFDEYGIQAIQGQVACDQGAAEGLGTEAEMRVAVYFDTREDAEAFSSQPVGGVVTETPIVRVTTYCLD